MRGRKRHRAVWGAFIFALTIALVVMAAVVVYDKAVASGATEGEISLIMLLVIIFAALLCTVSDAIRRKIMVDAPVSKILTATEKIASGDFSYRTQIDRAYGAYTSYDLIMENINIMAEELEKSEVLKSDFISNVSHELKTPIAVMQSYAVLLCDEGLDAEERKRYAETILSASRRLSALVGNILKLNKLENSEIHPELERINLTEHLAACVLAFEDAIEKKEISLDCDLDDVYITSSPSYLEIVWNNLVSNAVKFTDVGGSIFVSLKAQNGRAEVKIRDTGCGISPEAGAKIFEKFYQADTSHKEEGNGLGLSLVKRVISILGGEITVESEVGRGTAFTVTLKDMNNEG